MAIEHARRIIGGTTGTYENISWSASNASRQPQLARTISPTAQLPASCPRHPHKKSSSNHRTYCTTVRMNAIHSQSLFAWTLKDMSDTLISPLGKLYTASSRSELCASMLM